MHPGIFAAFDRICRRRFGGGRVLELGAVSAPDTLLCLPALAGARERVGLNIQAQPPLDGARMLRGDANAMAEFATGSFDAVLCNAMLEHDRNFWLTLSEIRRVVRPGGLVAIGVPGYDHPPLGRERRLLLGLRRVLPRASRLAQRVEARIACSPTLLVHDFPGDYYRFSPQAMREVLLARLDAVETATLLMPPRLIGSGLRPGGEGPA